MTTETVKEYRTTREECQRQIDKTPVVCPGCGGTVVPLETVDNSHNPTFWSGCEHCMQFTHGVPLKIFQIAHKLVHEHNHRAYTSDRFPHAGTDAEKAYYYESQVRGTCSEVSLVLKINSQLTENQ